MLVTISGGLVALGKPLEGSFYTGDYEFEKLVTNSRNYNAGKNNYNGINCHFLKKDYDENAFFASTQRLLLQAKEKNKLFLRRRLTQITTENYISNSMKSMAQESSLSATADASFLATKMKSA